MNDTISKIKKDIQLIIDAMAVQNFSDASIKLVEVSDELDDLIDTTDDEETMVEIAKYQVLLNHLQIKMSTKE
ncbi:hypothetical protein ACFSX9_00295 [Flavobacterium ardleyense]|uniref:Phage protein n=1 Tax=Flavobacterium ardleyense TaxID=2038737 RepID=A0ABW5Z328_9FLAO